MRAVPRTRYRRLLAACSALAAAAAISLSAAPPVDAAPYVSCPGGYIAPTLDECPKVPRTRGGGGNPSDGGVLGDLLDRIGLGGLGTVGSVAGGLGGLGPR
jgi:hypothetical protein